MSPLKLLVALFLGVTIQLHTAHAHRQDCEGAWGFCGKKCLKTYKVTKRSSNGGKQCPYKDGTKESCTGGRCTSGGGPSPGPAPKPAPKGITKIFTDDEVNQCYGKISKSPQLIHAEKSVFIVIACRMGGKNSEADERRLSVQAAEVDSSGEHPHGRRLDPTSASVCLIKQSDDGGNHWHNFRVLTPGGWSGGYYHGCKAIYDKVHKRILYQYSRDHSNTQTVYQIHSDDQGARWSKPRDLTKYLIGCGAGQEGFSGNTAGDRIELPLKQWPKGRVMFGTGQTQKDEFCFWYSEDGGRTYNTTRKWFPNTNELSMVVADEKTGLLLINSRATKYRGKEFKTRKNFWSHDGGITWRGPEESGLKDAENGAGHGCEASLLNMKNKLFFFNPTGGGGGKYPSRTNMVARCSLDHGKTWPHEYKVKATSEGGYSAMLEAQSKLILAWGVGDSHAAHPQRNVYVQIIDTNWCK
jgi:hypothetical protein